MSYDNWKTTDPGDESLRSEPSNQDSFLDEEGCLFPDECCMPGPHLKSECHTAEMLESLKHSNNGQMSQGVKVCTACDCWDVARYTPQGKGAVLLRVFRIALRPRSGIIAGEAACCLRG
jgi:hypothetical protein